MMIKIAGAAAVLMFSGVIAVSSGIAAARTAEPPAGTAPARVAAESIMGSLAAAWNRGDIEAFAAVYASDATFISPRGSSTGRQVILDRYRKLRESKEALGTLSFDVLEARMTSCGEGKPGGTLSLIARYHLRPAEGAEATGLTLLVLHATNGGFEIVQDASLQEAK
jgi:uncharacterized protein (TIGR02246 family)